MAGEADRIIQLQTQIAARTDMINNYGTIAHNDPLLNVADTDRTAHIALLNAQNTADQATITELTNLPSTAPVVPAGQDSATNQAADEMAEVAIDPHPSGDVASAEAVGQESRIHSGDALQDVNVEQAEQTAGYTPT